MENAVSKKVLTSEVAACSLISRQENHHRTITPSITPFFNVPPFLPSTCGVRIREKASFSA
jgi:hypothetical protein